MKRSFRVFKKVIISVLALSVMLAFSACGGAGEENGTYLSLIKDGTIQSNIKESFEESYYGGEDELQQSISALADSYNNRAGAQAVTIEKVEVKDSVALVELTYAGAEDYAAFNQVLFFWGTGKDAENAGYDLNVVLSGVKDAQETIGKTDILALEDEKLLVTDISEEIKLDGKALYTSDNVTVSSDGKTVKRADDGNEMLYVVYK